MKYYLFAKEPVQIGTWGTRPNESVDNWYDVFNGFQVPFAPATGFLYETDIEDADCVREEMSTSVKNVKPLRHIETWDLDAGRHLTAAATYRICACHILQFRPFYKVQAIFYRLKETYRSPSDEELAELLSMYHAESNRPNLESLLRNLQNQDWVVGYRIAANAHHLYLKGVNKDAFRHEMIINFHETIERKPI